MRRPPLTSLQTGPFLIFFAVLVAYAAQTKLAQSIQQSYKRPYFLLYLTHSAYLVIFPLHLLALRLSGRSCAELSELLSNLRTTLAAHLRSQQKPYPPKDASNTENPEDQDRKFPRMRFIGQMLFLTLSMALPAGCWYAAVPLASMTVVTALYNTSACWVFVLSGCMLYDGATGKPRWDMRQLVSISCAVMGVFVIALGDYQRAKLATPRNTEGGGTAAQGLLGSALAILGSMTYALYEVWYKWRIALPEPSGELRGLRPDTAVGVIDHDVIPGPPFSPSGRPSQGPEPAGRPSMEPLLRRSSYAHSSKSPLQDASPALFLLHADLVTSLIGLCTLLVLWIPIPVLDVLGWEPFLLPPPSVVPKLAAMVSMGVIFNGGFMVLLGLWGPVIASVGNLCTLVLIGVADAVLGPPGLGMSGTSVLGSVLIVGAFGTLAWDMRDGVSE